MPDAAFSTRERDPAASSLVVLKIAFLIVVLLTTMFVFSWGWLALCKLPIGPGAPVTRTPTDGAFGFSAAEWSAAFGATWLKAAGYTALCPVVCLISFMIRRLLAAPKTT